MRVCVATSISLLEFLVLSTNQCNFHRMDWRVYVSDSDSNCMRVNKYMYFVRIEITALELICSNGHSFFWGPKICCLTIGRSSSMTEPILALVKTNSTQLQA